MNSSDVLELLAANQNDRGIENWKKLGFEATGLSSYGIGLTQLRRLAKQIGRNHILATKLWDTRVYDAKVIALLIDDPQAMTREQAESLVEEVGPAQLSHVFSSCDSSLAKTPFVVDLVDAWTKSDDGLRRSCGYGLLSEVAKFKGKKSPDDAYFLAHVGRIDKAIDQEKSGIQLAMAYALIAIGKRTASLNAAALRVAKRAGPIEFETPSGRCEPFDAAKHLASPRLREKLDV